MIDVSTEILLNYCLKHKKSLTPARHLVIKTLAKHSNPKSAYDLQKEIKKTYNNNLNISTIYRVLEFWMKLGLIHKVMSINKFLICRNPDLNHTHILNFCTVCEKVVETCSETMSLNLKKSTSKLDLSLNGAFPVEVPVICSKCS